MPEVEQLASRYYNFILKYEDYLNDNLSYHIDYSKYPVKESELMNKIIAGFEEMYVKEYVPWRKIEGYKLEGLIKIFSERNEEIINYLRISDLLGDTLESCAEEELIKYYKSNGKDIEDDKIQDDILVEVIELSSKSSIDKNIYSKNTIRLHELAYEINKICEDLYKFYNQEKKNNLEEIEEELEK